MTDVDWFVMIAALGMAGAGVSWYRYRRWRLVLSPGSLEFAAVDPLSAAEFIRYCAALVRLLGYQRVRRARRGAVSFTATAPDGTLAAFRCARQKDSVAADVVRALRAGIAADGHAGRSGIIVTNALVTPEARTLASEAGITVADRAVLRHWMELARATLTADAPGSAVGAAARGGARVPAGAATPTGPVTLVGGSRATVRSRAPGRSLTVEARVMAGMVGGAALIITGVAIHAAIGTGTSRTVTPRTAANVVAASTPAARGPAGSASASSPPSTGSPASHAGTGSGGGSGFTKSERHLLHIKHVEHVEHMRHVE